MDEEVITLIYVGVYRLIKHRERFDELLQEAEEANAPRLVEYARAIAKDELFGDVFEDVYGIMSLDETMDASSFKQRDMFMRLCWAAKETRMWTKRVERGLLGEFDTFDIKSNQTGLGRIRLR